MPAGPEFPAFLSLKSGGSGQAEADFVAAVESATSKAQAKIRDFSSEAQRNLEAALSVKRNNVGSLDLGVDQLRAATAAQEARAVAAREVANALNLTAREEQAYTREMREQIVQARALADAEEAEAASLRGKVALLGQVQERLNRQVSATDAVVTSTRRGIGAFDASTSSVRAQRFAMVQAGQQMQDMAVQFQSGTRASTVLAQQLPQLAYAFSGLEGKVGTVARLLSGPWSIALVAGSALLGGFIDHLLDSGDAADKSASATSQLKDKLDLSKNSYESLIAVVNEYNKAQDKSTALTYEAIIAAEKQAEANLKAAKSEAARLAAEVARGPTGPGGQGQYGASLALNMVDSKIKSLEADLANSQVAAAQARSDVANDPRKQIEIAYNAELVRWQEKLKQGKVDEATLQRVNIRLDKDRIAALKAYDEAHRRGSSANREYGREINSTQARSIAEAAGLQVNGGDRTYARQKQLYDAWVAAGKPSNNPVAVPGTSAHERGNALDIQITAGVTAASIKKAYADEGVRLTKIFKEKGHYHIEWSTSGADKVERQADQLAQFGERAAEKIARINDRFNEAPKLIDAARASTADLDATIKDLSERKPPGFEAMIADAERAKGVIQDALVRPFQELDRDSNRRIEVAKLIATGREEEADALQTIWRLESQLGPLSEERKNHIRDIVTHEREVTDALEGQRIVLDAYLEATRSVRGELEAILSGTGNLANFQRIFQQLRGRVLTEQIFGPALRELETYVRKNTFGPAVDDLTSETHRASDAIGAFADAATSSAARLNNPTLAPISAQGAGSDLNAQFDAAFASKTTKAANDNGEIVVTAPRNTVMAMTPEAYVTQLSDAISKPMIKALEKAIGIQLPAGMAQALSGAFGGYATAGTLGAGLGLLSSIPGLGGSKGIFGKALGGAQTGNLIAALSSSLGLGLNTGGSQIGGAIAAAFPSLGIGSLSGSLIGGIAGNAGSLTGTIGSGLGGILGQVGGTALGSALGVAGSIAGPVGAVIGSLLGSLIGGLFGKRPRGAGTVTNTAVTASANDSGVTSNLNTMGGSLQSAIQKIADAFGTTVGSYSVGIGQYKDYYQVSGRAGDPYLGNSYFHQNSSYDLYDGKSAEEAMRAAILGALQDGAIQGIKAGAQRLLTAGKDLDTQIQKALDFQSVFDRLKSYTDPVGYALDKLNKEFSHLKDVFAEAGASSEEYAQLEKLYGIERAKAIEEATSRVSASLKSLYEELTVGDSGLSLRDRRANARAIYDPLAARVAAGDTTAYDDFAAAARTLLDLERQISGSQGSYFDLFNQVKDLTKTTLDATTAASSSSANYPSPFTTVANDNAAVVDGLGQLSSQLTAVNQNLGTLILQGGLGGTTSLSNLVKSQVYF